MLRAITSGEDPLLELDGAGHHDGSSASSDAPAAANDEAEASPADRLSPGADEILAASRKVHTAEEHARAEQRYRLPTPPPAVVQQTSMRRGSWFGLYREDEAEHHQQLAACKTDADVAAAFGREVRVVARRRSAEHLIATKALRCTATAWILIVAESFAKF